MFAFVIDPSEADRFSDHLKAALPGLVEQKALEPALATALAEISEVQSRSPTLLANVEIPREALALRTKASITGERPANETETVTAPRDATRPAAASEREAGSDRAAVSQSKAKSTNAVANSPGIGRVLRIRDRKWVCRIRVTVRASRAVKASPTTLS